MSWFLGDGVVGLCTFKARTGKIGRCFVFAPSTHKALLIGLHLIQASRNTVTVSGWHSGFEDFELEEVYTMAASHSGSFGKAYREVVVLVWKVCLWFYAGHLCERGRGRLV